MRNFYWLATTLIFGNGILLAQTEQCIYEVRSNNTVTTKEQLPKSGAEFSLGKSEIKCRVGQTNELMLQELSCNTSTSPNVYGLSIQRSASWVGKRQTFTVDSGDRSYRIYVLCKLP